LSAAGLERTDDLDRSELYQLSNTAPVNEAGVERHAQIIGHDGHWKIRASVPAQ
jgi:hypothetical protein